MMNWLLLAGLEKPPKITALPYVVICDEEHHQGRRMKRAIALLKLMPSYGMQRCDIERMLCDTPAQTIYTDLQLLKRAGAVRQYKESKTANNGATVVVNMWVKCV